MSPEKAKKLINIYPKLFADLHEKSCMRMFGFECGNGWFDILKELIEKIKSICETKHLDIWADQVKEKYGTLRVYLSSETDEIGDLINAAEDKSSVTCERCGSLGSMREEGRWYSVRCDACWNRPRDMFP